MCKRFTGGRLARNEHVYLRRSLSVRTLFNVQASISGQTVSFYD